MKKTLNETNIANELKGSSLFFQRESSKPTSEHMPVEEKPVTSRGGKEKAIGKPVSQSTSRAIGQSTGESTVQSTNRLIDRSTILGRPKAFYITECQDEDLNAAVDKLAEKVKGKVNEKIDRSTVVRLLLEVNNVTDDQTIDRLASQMVNRLIRQLTGDRAS